MKASLKIVHWTPRVLCILAILFVSLFALDSFGPQLTVWQQIGGFLIHLIPSFILIGLLIVAWKYELVGGIIFAAIGFGTAPWIFLKNYHMNDSAWMSIGIIAAVCLPFVLIGGLFILSHFLKKKNK